MAWLDKLLGRGSVREIGETVEEPATTPATSSPPLLLLVSDASGMAAFRLMRFDDAAAACDYVEFWRPSSSAGTVYAIWGLPGEPDPSWADSPEQRGEAVVLVKDDRQQDVVYPFSFLDFDSAWAFVRDEIEKELDPSRMMVYWAVPVEISADTTGKTHMNPDVAPTSVPVEHVAPTEREAPEAQPGTIFGFEGLSATKESLEAAERLFEDDGDDVPADIGEADSHAEANDVEHEPEVPAAGEERDEAEAAAVETAEPIEALPEVVVEKFGTPFHADEFREAPAPDLEPSKANGNGANGHTGDVSEEPVADGRKTAEVKAEPATSGRKKKGKGRRARNKRERGATNGTAAPETDGDADEPAEIDLTLTNGDTVNGNGHKPAPEVAESMSNGHGANGNGQQHEHAPDHPEPDLQSAASNGTWTAQQPAVPTANGHTTNGNGHGGLNQNVDLAEEIAKLLEGRKLTQREEPFEGFNSPPGRF